MKILPQFRPYEVANSFLNQKKRRHFYKKKTTLKKKEDDSSKETFARADYSFKILNFLVQKYYLLTETSIFLSFF